MISITVLFREHNWMRWCRLESIIDDHSLTSILLLHPEIRIRSLRLLHFMGLYFSKVYCSLTNNMVEYTEGGSQPSLHSYPLTTSSSSCTHWMINWYQQLLTDSPLPHSTFLWLHGYIQITRFFSSLSTNGYRTKGRMLTCTGGETKKRELIMRVASNNILAGSLGSEKHFPYVKPEILDWVSRFISQRKHKN